MATPDTYPVHLDDTTTVSADVLARYNRLVGALYGCLHTDNGFQPFFDAFIRHFNAMQGGIIGLTEQPRRMMFGWTFGYPDGFEEWFINSDLPEKDEALARYGLSVAQVQAVVATAAGLQVGLAICYDLRFPLHARVLADRGAGLIVYPSAFTATTGAAHWALLLRACAVQNGCYVLGANQCGRHSETRASFGHSMLVDPWGRVVAGAEGDQADRPGVVFGTVDPAVLDQVRSGLPVHTHQRFKVNGPYDL